MKQNLFWQTQLLHNVSSALAMGTKHTSARTKLCVVPVEASMKGEPAKFLNSFSSQNAATAEELTQPELVSVQYARKQPRRQEKHGTHAQENMRSQQLPLFQLYNPPQLCLSLSLSLYQGGKNVKQLSQAEAQRDSEVHSQKCKFFLQDQPTLEESYQLTPSRSLMLRCLHERHKADTSPV